MKSKALFAHNFDAAETEFAADGAVWSDERLMLIRRVAQQHGLGYVRMTPQQTLAMGWRSRFDRDLGCWILVADEGVKLISAAQRWKLRFLSQDFAGSLPEEMVNPKPFIDLLRAIGERYEPFAQLLEPYRIMVRGHRSASLLAESGADLVVEADGAWPNTCFQVLVHARLGLHGVYASVLRESVPWARMPRYVMAVLFVAQELRGVAASVGERQQPLAQRIGLERFRRLVDAECERLPHEIDQLAVDLIVDERLTQFPVPHSSVDLRLSENTNPVAAGYQCWVDRYHHATRIQDRVAVRVNHVTSSKERAMLCPSFDSNKYPDADIRSKGTGAPSRAYQRTLLSAHDLLQLANLSRDYSRGFLYVTRAGQMALPAVRVGALFPLFHTLKCLNCPARDEGCMNQGE